MKIAVIGANGKIGRLLIPLLIQSGHSVTAMVREEEQKPFFESLGARPVLADLEGAFSHGLEGADAVVFTAGSGAKTGPDKTIMVDLYGAIRSFEACERLGVRRYVMVSALRAAAPEEGPEGLRPYLVAKKIADEYLQRSALEFTVLRPGRLTDDGGPYRVKLGANEPPEVGNIARGAVAEAIVSSLECSQTIGKTIWLLDGAQAPSEAFSGIAG